MLSVVVGFGMCLNPSPSFFRIPLNVIARWTDLKSGF